MDIKADWEEIREIFNAAINSSRYYSIASTNPDGTPHVTPIGSLILYGTGHGVYGDGFPEGLSRNIENNQRVCVMAVDMGLVFWLKSLFKGRFTTLPGIRLTGMAGEKRLGTREEIDHWQGRMKTFRRLKGYDLLWKNMTYVRDIHFDGVIPLKAGRMTAQWN